jgi:hypothetical protein
MFEQLLEKQLANIVSELQPDTRILSQQRRHD